MPTRAPHRSARHARKLQTVLACAPARAGEHPIGLNGRVERTGRFD